ncbi:MAG: transglutaminase domain-containing protein, partial [Spirochaetales bacterium]|nr:transglutaminase domain-containing protein [Spirochaetales bacterium]
VFPRFPLLYAVPGYGMSFDESKLGSRPHLIDTPLFEVEGPSGQTLYLRTRVFDSYNGSSWSMSGYFQKTQPVRASLVDFLSSDGEVPDEALTLSMAGRSFFYLPHTLNTKKIYLESSQPLLKGGTMATGFELSGPFRDGEKIHLEQYFPGELEPEILKTDARESYLQIPEDLPEALREIARGLSRDTVSKIEILARIEAFLAYNYTYSIDVDEYAYDRTDTRAADFAYSFLFERSTGYCVHFATSFILLARLSGVPARYATGFLARIPPGETTATVTGLSAHAWPEVWLEGSGWINWEATPAANAANYTITGNEWLFNLGIDLDPATTRQLEGLIGGSIVEADGSRHREGRKTVPVKLSLVVLGSIAGAALLVVFSVRFAYPSIRYIADEEGRLYFGMRRLSRRLERKGVPRPVKTGWVLWAENLKKRIGTIDTQIDTQGEGSDEPGDPLIDTMIGTLMGLAYGGQAWSPEASSRFAAFRKYVLRNIRRRKKRREYSVS